MISSSINLNQTVTLLPFPHLPFLNGAKLTRIVPEVSCFESNGLIVYEGITEKDAKKKNSEEMC